MFGNKGLIGLQLYFPSGWKISFADNIYGITDHLAVYSLSFVEVQKIISSTLRIKSGSGLVN